MNDLHRLVFDDVSTGLSTMFSRDDDLDEPVAVNSEIDDEDGVIGDDLLSVVPWVFSCVHDGDFLGLFPTGRKLRIQGVTFVDSRRGETLMHRYVDWMGVATQLGLEVSTRVPVDEAEYRNVLASLRPGDNG